MASNKFIEQLVARKHKDVSELIEQIENTKDHALRKELIFCLIDNYRDERIPSILIELIKRRDLKDYIGTYIFACNEYSANEFKSYLDLFVEIVIQGDYESSWSATQLILDFQEPFEWEEDILNQLEAKLKSSLKKERKNKEFIEATLKLFES